MPFSCQNQGVPTVPSVRRHKAAPAVVKIKPCLCWALMFPGGRSFNGTVECCFYTRFISTVNIPPQSCYLSMPWMLIGTHETGGCCRYTPAFTFKELSKQPLGRSRRLPKESSAALRGEGGGTRSRTGLATGSQERGFKGDSSDLFSQRHLYRAHTLYCLEEPCTSAIKIFGRLGYTLSWAAQFFYIQ